MLCPLTALSCLACCGGPDGDRCPVAPPYSNPLARAGFADPGACYTGPASTPQERTLALAQLAEHGALTAQTGTGPGLITANLITQGFLALRILRAEVLVKHRIAFEEKVRAENQAWAEAERERRREEERALRQRLEVPEITLGERIGWRMWWYQPPRPRLRAFAVGRWWKPGIPMTGKPDLEDYTGVWAFKNRTRALDKARTAENLWWRPNQRAHAVWGAVALWGDILEYEDGWRASHARILSLDSIVMAHPRNYRDRQAHYHSYAAALTALRTAYGVGSWRDYTIKTRRQKYLTD